MQLDHTEELSPAGDTLWGLIRRELELEWTNGFWLPRTGLPQEKHDLLFDAADWLLNTPSDPDSERGYYLPDNDLRTLIDRLRAAIKNTPGATRPRVLESVENRTRADGHG